VGTGGVGAFVGTCVFGASVGPFEGDGEGPAVVGGCDGALD
jgi:hypothetical protein